MDQIIGLVSNYAKPRYEDDFVDRLNFQYTSYIFGFSALVIGYNTYFGTSIRCWTPAEFRDGWSEYARDYCLIENTYYLPLEDPNLPPAEQREQKELTYYQWVQFILVFLAFLFYLPYLFWKTVNWWSGLQVRSVVKASVELDKTNMKERQPQMEKIANHLYQFVDHGGHRKSPIPLVPNIIGRNWVAVTYIITKVLFVINLVAQLILIHIFLGFRWGDFFSFRIGFGSNWINNGIFPRQTMCDFDIRNKGSIQQYSIQCVLPMNMLNEKIFLILFYWLIVLLFITIYNLSRSISSFFLFTSRQEFAHRMLHAGYYDHSDSPNETTSSEKVPLIDRPVSLNSDQHRFSSLSPDLVVILSLIAKNAGDNVSIQKIITEIAEYRICCDSGKKTEKCTKFQNLTEMLGFSCCANQIYTTRENICCEGKVYERDRGGGVMAHSCCSSQPLRLDQTCCSGKIHNIISGDCCGEQVYFRRDPSLICCNSTLSNKTTPNDICCGITSYNPLSNSNHCCGDKVSKLDSCCITNSGEFKDYDSNTHVCCDGPMLKQSTKLACCYLKKDEKFINTQYDKSKQCCKYPYDKLYLISKNGTC
ncbi:unnamed protein product [Caenorhabditis angaria]|uniref:Innexin n=1 Tax=Caenorhabditis angaria TaxID=860376 RepID=A0A9P1I343_9PELO|nr:unnamed protein product [Caenorhabditis angaria]